MAGAATDASAAPAPHSAAASDRAAAARRARPGTRARPGILITFPILTRRASPGLHLAPAPEHASGLCPRGLCPRPHRLAVDHDELDAFREPVGVLEGRTVDHGLRIEE